MEGEGVVPADGWWCLGLGELEVDPPLELEVELVAVCRWVGEWEEECVCGLLYMWGGERELRVDDGDGGAEEVQGEQVVERLLSERSTGSIWVVVEAATVIAMELGGASGGRGLLW